MKHQRVKWLIACVGALLAVGSLWAEERARRTIAPDQFNKLLAVIKPRAGEDRWAEIPWLTSLWQARQRAAAEGKPILLWEMDGHPLGCT